MRLGLIPDFSAFARLPITSGNILNATTGRRLTAQPIGDTLRPKGADGASLDLTLARAQLASAGVPGQRYITSAVRDYGLGSPDSDHLRGRALDVVGANLGGFASAIRAAGGFAEMHGDGADRHLHAVPIAAAPASALAPARSGGATTVIERNHTQVVVNIAQATAGIDVKRAVRQALSEADRDRQERRGRGGR